MRKVFGEIYVITNEVTRKCYVGQTVRSIALRFREHLIGRQDKNNLYIDRSIKKHGITNFSVCAIQEAFSREELDALEIQYIKEFETLAPQGYNLTEGGSGSSGWKHSAETRRRMSDSQKRSYANGVNPGRLGKKHTEATKAKLRRPKTEAEKLKIGLAKKGKPSKNGFRSDPQRRENAHKVHALRREGFTTYEIGEKLNMSPANAGLVLRGKVFPDIHEEELSKGFQYESKKEKRARKIHVLKRQGLTTKEIREELSISPRQIYAILHGTSFSKIYEEQNNVAQ
jgi:group I intron endonuclease